MVFIKGEGMNYGPFLNVDDAEKWLRKRLKKRFIQFYEHEWRGTEMSYQSEDGKWTIEPLTEVAPNGDTLEGYIEWCKNLTRSQILHSLDHHPRN